MKKIKILYDIDFLIRVWRGHTVGAGIYYTAFNVFQQLNMRDDVEVYAYSGRGNFGLLRFALLNNYPLPNLRQIKLDFLSELYARGQYYWFWSEKNEKNSFFAKVKRNLIRLFFQRPIRLIINCFKPYQKIVDSCDCYFSPVYKVPLFIENNLKLKKFTILYDAIPFLFPSLNAMSSQKSWYMKLVSQINRNDYYFTISECSKKDLIKTIPQIDSNKIYIIPLAASDRFYPNSDFSKKQAVRKKYNIPPDKKYYLSVCTIDPRKNLIFAVKNFLKFASKNNIDDLIFVLAGGHWKELSPEVISAIAELGYSSEKIIQTGYVDDEDLASLYSNAECFVYPSLYEGFGLPPLEAMQCGTPVITSNTSSLPEVVGDAAIMIDPHDDNALILAYEKTYYDNELKKELSRKGIERAKLFSWEKCADIIVDKIKKVCGEV